MPPDLKSSTTHSKPGQYTSTETDWGNRTPTPTYTVQDKTNTGQTCTGQQNKVKDAGTRISKIAKNTLKRHKKQINLNAHSLKWALKLKAHSLKQGLGPVRPTKETSRSSRRNHSATN